MQLARIIKSFKKAARNNQCPPHPSLRIFSSLHALYFGSFIVLTKTFSTQKGKQYGFAFFSALIFVLEWVHKKSKKTAKIVSSTPLHFLTFMHSFVCLLSTQLSFFSEKPQFASGLHWKKEFIQSDCFWPNKHEIFSLIHIYAFSLEFKILWAHSGKTSMASLPFSTSTILLLWIGQIE